jgi:uncharacterized protein Smg (DUF494 family)
MQWFKDAQKLFPGNHNRLASQEAYDFLRKYIGSSSLTINYLFSHTFPQEEFKNELELLGSLEMRQQIETLTQQNSQLQIQNQQTVTNLNNQITSLNQTLAQVNITSFQQQQTIIQLQTELGREKDKNKHLLEQLTQIEQPPK